MSLHVNNVRNQMFLFQAAKNERKIKLFRFVVTYNVVTNFCEKRNELTSPWATVLK